eukprot:m.311361 g.311361  ORF g.311361 m.311361 type:complete len:123 (+) comp66852_c0_seq1:51-419(+)
MATTEEDIIIDEEDSRSEKDTSLAGVPEEESQGVTASKQERLLQLPLARVKNMIKIDPDISLASQESVFLIAKATELFVASLAKEVHRKAKEGKRKTLQRRDIDLTIEEIEQLAFLEGAMDT